MGHSGINLQGGISGFAQSVQQLKSKGMDKDVKFYATPVKSRGKVQKDENGNIKYSIYASNKSKGKWPGAESRQNRKAEMGSRLLTDFLNKMQVEHNLDKKTMMDANILVAKIGVNRQHVAKDLKDLADLLENATGVNPWKARMKDNEAKKQVQQEYRQITQGMKSGQKGLLNPKSDFAKAIKQNVMPVSSQPPASKGIKTLNLEDELGSM